MPFLITAERSFTLVMGQHGGHAHGEGPLRRFYIVDGTGRIHPLRERYRQRVRRILRLPKPTLPPAEPRELEQQVFRASAKEVGAGPCPRDRC